ncbi:DUF58 domain-containing protein [Actinomadura luteofluorescens]|uniref:DUF58 domain-containing protein n=1 Tax=Actinomadura luteofluorescens TaxID=46163 RepID=UPI00363538D0
MRGATGAGCLTTRGRSFVAAGATAIVCAVALGERDLLRAGVLVLALPLLCTIAVARTRYRLACARRLEPARLPVGHESRVDLRLENVSRLPSGLLMVEDRVPYALGGRARFVLERIEPHAFRELGYRIRSDVRGRYRVGPLTVRLADPFGMVELVRSFSLSDTLTVTPTIVPLPPGRLSGAWTGGGDSVARAVSAAGEDDVAPREYRHGDDLRRVHWRSTARHGELMVRREEQHFQSSGTLFLDTRRSAHWGDGPAPSSRPCRRPRRSASTSSGRGWACGTSPTAGRRCRPGPPRAPSRGSCSTRWPSPAGPRAARCRRGWPRCAAAARAGRATAWSSGCSACCRTRRPARSPRPGAAPARASRCSCGAGPKTSHRRTAGRPRVCCARAAGGCWPSDPRRSSPGRGRGQARRARISCQGQRVSKGSA